MPEVKEEDFEVDDDIDVETVEVTDASLKPEDAEVPATGRLNYCNDSIIDMKQLPVVELSQLL